MRNCVPKLLSASGILCLLFLGSLPCAFAQPAKHGAKTVSSSLIINEYTYITSDVSAGSKTLTVNESTLNLNARFPSVLGGGDLLMIIQMQGVSLTSYNDSSWGSISAYNNCGLYEFAQVLSVSGSLITLDCNLINNYSAAGKTQVVRIPRYASLTVNSGGTLSPAAWNGQSGGVLALEVEGNTIVNSGGKLDATGKGFRGGQTLDNNYDFAVTDYVNTSDFKGAEKGESVAGYKSDYDAYGGRYCRGAAANGGGGGNAHTSGGGGGANAGVVSAWTGKGNPDISKPAWVTAWNLESNGFANTTSSGGGRGGYNWSGSKADPTVYGPSNYAIWGGDSRWNHGGLGGRPLDYSSGRIFMGGGGGAGEQNDTRGGKGGDGGGIIYLIGSGSVSGSGQIVSSGNNGADAGLGTIPNSGTDAAGGAGGGGTIMLNVKGTISGVSLLANGGIGGYQKLFLNPFSMPKEAEGPGGGGGGGFIAISNGSPSMQVLGGKNGLTNSPSLTAFPPDGATMGGAGIISQSLTNYSVVAHSASVCPGNTASLSITTSGLAPQLSSFAWYDQAVGGNLVSTGSSFTTPVLNSSKNYFVGTCPGFRRDTVKAIVYIPAVANAGKDTAICKGNTISLNGSGGGSYAWTPTGSLNNPSIANPIASPPKSTVYVLTLTDINNCKSKDSMFVKVDSILSVNAGTDKSVCMGSSVNLNASGGGTNYSWFPPGTLNNPSIPNPVASPTTTTTYVLTVSNASGCSGKDTVLVTVNPLPIARAGNDTSICTGSVIQLNASGGVTYSWVPSPGLNSTSIPNPTANPTVNTTYTLTAYSAAGCQATDMITITTGVKLNANAGRDTSICPGSSILLQGSGGQQYSWTPASSLNNGGIQNPIASPGASTIYTLNVQNSNGCKGIDSVKITVMPSFTVSAGTKDSVCAGSSILLKGSGASFYSWSPSSSLTNPNTANPLAKPSSDTYYFLTGFDNAGCMAKDSVEIKVLNAFPVSIFLSGSSAICFGDSVQLSATPGAASYSWSPASGLSSNNVSNPTAHPLVSTHYVLTAMSAGACPSKDSVDIIVRSLPIADAGPDQIVCNGLSVQMQGSGGLNYLWLPASGLNDPTISNPVATPDSSITYFLVVSDNYCSSADSVHLTVTKSQGTVNAGSDLEIYKGASIKLAPWGGTSYHWSPEEFLDCQFCENPVASPKTSMWYYVDALDYNGCRVSDSVFVSVIDGISVYVPSSFSPNRDDKNDIFVVSGINIIEFEMRIYTRWGNLVFESIDPFNGWDGNYQGSPVKEDVYVYIIHAVTDGGGSFDRTGGVTLIR